MSSLWIGKHNLISNLLIRWNCVLLDDNEELFFYQQKVYLLLATILHKYGFFDESITNKAIIAIDRLNEGVVLSDDFHRKSDIIKNFLREVPEKQKRVSKKPELITLFRPKDTISIKAVGGYCAAYIHYLSGVNECPVIEFYDYISENKPTISDLKNLKALGGEHSGGVIRKRYYRVRGLKYLPDLAHQVSLISANDSSLKPDSSHLEENIGLFLMEDLYSIQEMVKRMVEIRRTTYNKS